MSKIEQRVVSAGRPKVGAQRVGPRASQVAESEPEAAPEGKSKGKLGLVLGLVIAAVIGAGVYFFVFAGSGAEAEPKEPEPGVVQQIEAMSLNLGDGHYLRLGLGLQLVDGVDKVDESRARDAAIALFSGRTIKEVSSDEGRVKLKSTLTKQLGELYDGDVMGVYLTDFVTQ